MEGAWEAMSRIIIQQENETQLDTIRARVIEQSIWKQGQRIVHGTWTEGSKECWKHRKCTEACKDVQRVGNQFAEVGLEYFGLDYVSKNGVSVMECNSIPPSRTLSRGPIEFRGKFGLRSKFGCR